MLIKLSPDGIWRWWDLRGEGPQVSEPPLMSGKWFIREQVLYLRILQHSEGGGHGFSPGMAMALDIKSLRQDALVLSRDIADADITWNRVAEPGAPPNGGPATSPGNSELTEGRRR